MEKLKVKHFQYTGTDDYDKTIDEQLNLFLEKEGIDVTRLIDIKYSGHSSLGVTTYSALLIYEA